MSDGITDAENWSYRAIHERKIKKCPQCGAEDDYISLAGDNKDEPYHYVCSMCGLSFDKDDGL